MDDLSDLRSKHPSWTFNTVWQTSVSAADKRNITATRDGVVLSAMTPQLLSWKIQREEERKLR
jgi:hypothetical protein